MNIRKQQKVMFMYLINLYYCNICKSLRVSYFPCMLTISFVLTEKLHRETVWLSGQWEHEKRWVREAERFLWKEMQGLIFTFYCWRFFNLNDLLCYLWHIYAELSLQNKNRKRNTYQSYHFLFTTWNVAT
jgi:hypothetical protein